MAKQEFDLKLISRLKSLAERNEYKDYLNTLNNALRKVKIKENGEKMLFAPNHLRPDIFIDVSDRNVFVSNKKSFFLRKGVIDRLNKAQEILPKGHHLLLCDLFRTEKDVWKLYRAYSAELKQRENFLSKEEIDIKIRNILAMPDDPAPPGHMTGGAVDVVLADSNKKRIPLKIDYKKLPREKQMFTFCQELPTRIKKKRMILYEAMIAVGFNNYLREYWHYSYGDAYWAVKRKIKIAVYGIPKENFFEKI